MGTGRWEFGRVTALDAHRVGSEFGFSGRVYRVRLGLESGGGASVIAKFEHADAIQRAVAFRAANEQLLAAHIPVSFGSRIDVANDRGLIMLEDISPATQGDDLAGCSLVQAQAIIGVVAQLHANSWSLDQGRPPDSTTDWSERHWEHDRWSDRLRGVAERFSEHLDRDLLARLSEFPAEAADAHDILQLGPRAWVHRDPHPDNVLWRPDGRVVLLDWSNAMSAPPAIDVAVLLSSLSFTASAPLTADELLVEYSGALARHGLYPDPDAIRRSAAAGVRLLVRGSIGWAGSPAVPGASLRMLRLQAQAAARVRPALAWLDR